MTNKIKKLLFEAFYFINWKLIVNTKEQIETEIETEIQYL